MAIAGSLTYDTKIDKSGFESGLNSLTGTAKTAGTKIKSIITALGITKLISTTINTINKNLDSSISRLDTLNNYPRVMSNLGISAEDAEESIKTLSDKLTGLPTALNDASLSVQRFTSANGNVKKSTNYYLALNNALLAGGASADIQASAMEQLSQAYAKGKPDAMEWRSMLTAMPGQLKQVATYLGYTSTAVGGDFYTAVTKGKISMDKFMDAFVTLNTKGVKGFQSFEEQAKNSVGGVSTSISNMKTAIVRGVTNIVDTVDKSLKGTSIGGLGNLINNIGKAIEKALKAVASGISKIDLNGIIKKVKTLISVYGPTVKKVIEQVVNAAKKLLDIIIKNKNVILTLIKVIVSLVAAYKAYLLIQKAVKAISMAQEFISMLSPTQAVVIAITALASALAVVNSIIRKDAEEMQEFARTVNENKQAYDNYQQSIQKTAEAELSHINQAQKLKNELTQITDENGKVKEGYEDRAKFILGELNNALGTEYSMNGNIINQYQQLQDEIDKIILKKKAEILMNMYSEQYKKALEDEKDAVKGLAEAEEKANKVAEKWNVDGIKGLKEKKAAMEEIRDMQVVKEFNPIAQSWYDEIDAAIKAYEDGTNQIIDINEKKKTYEEASIAYEKGEYEALGKFMVGNTENYTDANLQTIKDSLDKQSKEYKNYKSIYERTGNEVAKGLMENAKTNLNSLAQELKSRTSTIDSLGENEINAWKQLAESSFETYKQTLEGMPAEISNKIQASTGVIINEKDKFASNLEVLGNEGTAKLKESFKLDEATEEELNNANDKVKNNTELSESIKNTADEGSIMFQQKLKLSNTAQNQLSETANTIKSDSQVKNETGNLARETGNTFNSSINPFEWGSDLIKQIIGGMLGGLSPLINAANQVAGVISERLHFTVPDKGPLSDFDKSMPDMMDLMTKGINNNKSKVIKAINGLSQEMESKLENVVNLEMGKTNATATVKSNAMYNSVIQINADFDGNVEMDKTKVGRIVAPTVTKTIKAGGLV